MRQPSKAVLSISQKGKPGSWEYEEERRWDG